eukprot:SAG22_NODE_3237_length_1840_cov_1.705342_3_plen_351_part_00
MIGIRVRSYPWAVGYRTYTEHQPFCRWEHTWFAVVVSHAAADTADEAEGAAGTDPLALPCDVVPWKTLSAQQKERWWPEALAVLEQLETAHGLVRFDSNLGNFALRRGRTGVPAQGVVGAEGVGSSRVDATAGAAAAAAAAAGEQGSIVVLLDTKTLLTLEQHARNLFHPENHPLPTAAAIAAAGSCTVRGFFQRALGADDAIFDDGLLVELALQASLPDMTANFDPTLSSRRPLRPLSLGGGEDLAKAAGLRAAAPAETAQDLVKTNTGWLEERRATLMEALRTAWAMDASGWGGLSPEDAFGRLLAVLQAVGLTYIRLKLGMLCRKFRGMPGITFLTDVPRRPSSYGC